MTFEKFQTLSEDTKIKKLIIAFEKVALRASNRPMDLSLLQKLCNIQNNIPQVHGADV